MERKQQHLQARKRVPRLWVGILSLLACMWLTGCIKEEYEPEPTATRTVLFYMGGDNNLYPEVKAKIEQLQQSATLPAGCRVLVFKDARGEQPALQELIMENEGWKVKTIQVYEQANSALAETFSNVLNQVREYYPAPSYGLVVFSHSSGWLPEGTYASPSTRSIIIDGQSEMEVPAFASAIPDGMFDFIIFETCHMAGVEVAWELKDKTEHILASSAEIVSPGFTPVWGELLPLLFKPEANLKGVMQKVEAEYLSRAGDYGSLTLSLIETKELDALAGAINNCPGIRILVDSLYRKGFSSPDIDRASIQSFDRNNQCLFFDLNDYLCFVLQEATPIAVPQAIRATVTHKVSTPFFMPVYGGFDIHSHCGLTTYIPQEQYPKLNEAYKQLKWYKEVLSNEKSK